MTQNCLAASAPTRSSVRVFVRSCVLVATATACLSVFPDAVFARPLRIAVAPFVNPVAAIPAGDAEVPAVADSPASPATRLGERAALAVAAALGEESLDRLIAPDAFRFTASAAFEPSAEEIRSWAYNAAVETVVVGRVVQTSAPGADSAEPHRIEIVLRSGHSGAEVGRHSATLANPLALDATGRALADAILDDLGYVASEAVGRDALHTVGFAAPIKPAPGGAAESGGRGLDASLDTGGFDRTAPIEIKAEEAEIINRGEGRNLVFQRNVLVQQANVTLRSDRLEASYKKGETEPERLVARGQVYVDQGGRRARCDRAIYLRAAQKLTCSGHAELIQGCDIVRGESIEFHLDQDRARVEGAASIVIRPESEDGASCAQQQGVM